MNIFRAMLRSSLSTFLRLGTHLSAVLARAELIQLHNCYLSWDLSSSIFIFIFIFFHLDLISHLAGKIRCSTTATHRLVTMIVMQIRAQKFVPPNIF